METTRHVAQAPEMAARRIPSSGEPIPVVGIGTYAGFDVAPHDDRYAALPAVLDALFAAGGSVIDSSPMYGRAEQTVGELLAAQAPQRKPFLASKVWTTGREAGIAEMHRSLELLRTERLDLMQVHNLVDWRTHLATLRDWKERGLVRYIGVTHYKAAAHAELEAVLRTEAIDFVQVNYSMVEPEAADHLLPFAAERGVAVIANRPFGGKSLMRSVRGRALPEWAGGLGASTWSDLAIAFVLAHDAVTCVIPGTGSAAHMAANVAAARVVLSQAQQRELLTLLR
jgi:diketogulonate reductase-like aldo/keto reductase